MDSKGVYLTPGRLVAEARPSLDTPLILRTAVGVIAACAAATSKCASTDDGSDRPAPGPPSRGRMNTALGLRDMVGSSEAAMPASCTASDKARECGAYTWSQHKHTNYMRQRAMPASIG